MGKIWEKVKANKKKVLIAAGAGVATVTGIVLCKKVPDWKKYPHKMTVRFGEAEYRDGFVEYFGGHGNHGRTDGGELMINVCADRLKEVIDKVTDGEPEERLYKIVVEKLPMETNG